MSRQRKIYRLKHERFGWPAGAIVYDSLVGSYGLVSQDTRITGREHVYVTVDEEPNEKQSKSLAQLMTEPPRAFTCPVDDLDEMTPN